MTPLAENLWHLSYPLKLLGVDLRRNVAVIRLSSGRLIIHSSAPFSAQDVAAIRSVGEPGWLLDAMLRHDTFAQHGHDAFPEVPYLAPPGFGDHVAFPVHALTPPPPEWVPEIAVMPLRGVPSMRETPMLHVPSRTLIVADLAMNFPGDVPFWQEMFLNVAIGTHHSPGIPRTWKLAIKDKPAFEESLEVVLSWDFDRIIVGHGSVLETDGKAKLLAAVREAGILQR